MSFIDFFERKIMVVGAASGIGRQTSILLSKLGGNVVLVDKNEDKLLEVKAELDNVGKHIAVTYDVSDKTEG